MDLYISSGIEFFLSDIQTFLNNHIKLIQDSSDKTILIEEHQNYIENQFNQFNIVFEDQSSSGSVNTSESISSINEINSDEKEQLKNECKKFYELFKQFRDDIQLDINIED